MGGMIVNHNMSSMFQHRRLKVNAQKVQESSEKLASGYKINHANDQAAELTVSEAMRNQIRGLNRASDNIQDGIGLVQVADAALQETQNILGRMVELTTQAANDINTETDRKAIQDEIDQLNQQIDHIAYESNFNQNYMLAEGTPQARPGYFYIQTGALAEQSIMINFVNAIEKAASWRNDFGAVWEKLEHAVKNADISSQNTQQSESDVRDTNIGDEILGYTVNQILVDASQSLLAQYNQKPEAIIALLK